MATLTVGSGQAYTTIASAVAASADGDVILVQAGTYTNDFATITTDITIKAVGGMAKLVATTAPPNGKAIFITRGDVTIQGLEFTGSKVPDGNGAGIRFEGGNLTVLDSHFHHNQNGILSGTYETATLTIRNSEFGHNGIGDGKTHNLYIGRIAQLTVEDSYFHDAVVGHEIKSRAFATTIRNSRIQDEDGSASYSIDLPNGGRNIVTGNVIEQGPRSQNPAIVHLGGEGTPYAATSLLMSDNVVINRLDSVSSRMLLNQTATTATLEGNAVFGLVETKLVSGPATLSGTTFLASQPVLDTSVPWGSVTPPPPPPPPAADIAGTAGADLVTLTAAVSGVVADLGAGSDRLVMSSAGPNDLTALNVERITGGSAADRVAFGTVAKSAVVDLGGGDDVLVLSSAGNNALTVSNVETITGGGANDAVTLGARALGITVDLGVGADRLQLSSLGANDVTVLNVETVLGAKAADRISVGAGAATMDGGAGNDTIAGGAGADRIIGGAGQDLLTGGGGVDRFVFRATTDSGLAAPDRIADFEVGVDDLAFSGLLHGSFAWRGAGALVAGGNSQARLDAATSTVFVDVDGNGSADMALNLSGSSLAGFGKGDFVWS